MWRQRLSEPWAAGFGYEITSVAVWVAYSAAMKAAEALALAAATKARIRVLAESRYSVVTEILRREVELPG